MTLEAGIPCVSFFFEKRRYAFSSPAGLTFQEAGLVSLLYSLTAQLINLLPETFQTELRFDEEDFTKLDGSITSVEYALEMIRKLLTLTPSTIVCVIDGLQDFETKETTRRHIEKLLDILTDQGSKTVVKALFTTGGMSRALASKVTGVRERVDALEVDQVRSGRFPRGYSGLSDVSSSSRDRPKAVPPSRRGDMEGCRQATEPRHGKAE